MSKNRSRDEDLIQRMSEITLKHALKIINVFECLEGTGVMKVETIVIKAEENCIFDIIHISLTLRQEIKRTDTVNKMYL